MRKGTLDSAAGMGRRMKPPEDETQRIKKLTGSRKEGASPFFLQTSCLPPCPFLGGRMRRPAGKPEANLQGVPCRELSAFTAMVLGSVPGWGLN